jgi:hypothetical protein
MTRRYAHLSATHKRTAVALLDSSLGDFPDRDVEAAQETTMG